MKVAASLGALNRCLQTPGHVGPPVPCEREALSDEAQALVPEGWFCMTQTDEGLQIVYAGSPEGLELAKEQGGRGWHHAWMRVVHNTWWPHVEDLLWREEVAFVFVKALCLVVAPIAHWDRIEILHLVVPEGEGRSFINALPRDWNPRAVAGLGWCGVSLASQGGEM